MHVGVYPQPEKQHTNPNSENEKEWKGLWQQPCPIMFSDYLAYRDAMHSLQDIF